MVSVLTRGQLGGFPRHAALRPGPSALSRKPWTTTRRSSTPGPVAERAYSRLIDRLSAEDSSRGALVDRSDYLRVFIAFFARPTAAHKTRDDREARLAVRWLSGDCLDPAEARLIGAAARPRRPTSLSPWRTISRSSRSSSP